MKKIALACEGYKLDIFKKRLAEAGYKCEEPVQVGHKGQMTPDGALEDDLFIIKVDVKKMSKFADLVQKMNNEARRKRMN